jgi:hypothetical protein
VTHTHTHTHTSTYRDDTQCRTSHGLDLHCSRCGQRRFIGPQNCVRVHCPTGAGHLMACRSSNSRCWPDLKNSSRCSLRTGMRAATTKLQLSSTTGEGARLHGAQSVQCQVRSLFKGVGTVRIRTRTKTTRVSQHSARRLPHRHRCTSCRPSHWPQLCGQDSTIMQ